MVNRYDNPAQAQFIDTYVPIPFEQLYRLGKDAQDQVNKATEDLNKAYTTWMDFTSPSEVDTQKWYDLTLGRGMPVINKMAANPDLIKTAEGRAAIHSMINNVDRAALMKLKQSAAGLTARQENERALMKANRWNKNWHGFDYANYDTLGGDGVFNDTTLLPYMDVRDLSNPYYKELKPGYIGTQGGYDYVGITRNDVERVADAHLNDILNTPQAAEHMRQYMSQTGASQEQAVNWLRQNIVDSNLDRIYQNREANPYALLNARSALSGSKKSGSGSSDESVRRSDWYDESSYSFDMAQNEKHAQNPLLSKFDSAELQIQNEYLAYEEALKKGEISESGYTAAMKNLSKQYEELIKNRDTARKNEYKDLFFSRSGGVNPADLYGDKKLESQKWDINERAARGANELVSEYLVPSNGFTENSYYKYVYGDSYDVNINGTPTKAYTVNTNGFLTDFDLAYKIMGLKRGNSAFKFEDDNNGMSVDFEDMLRNGKFGSVVMVPKGTAGNITINGHNNLIFGSDLYISADAIASQLDDMDSGDVVNYFEKKLGSNAIVRNGIHTKVESENSTQSKLLKGDYIRISGAYGIPDNTQNRLIYNVSNSNNAKEHDSTDNERFFEIDRGFYKDQLDLSNNSNW